MAGKFVDYHKEAAKTKEFQYQFAKKGPLLENATSFKYNQATFIEEGEDPIMFKDEERRTYSRRRSSYSRRRS